MVNMNVRFVRGDNKVITLARECTAKWPRRQADLGIVTGYPSSTNFSGHNPDANGIAHAIDIGTYVNGDINEFDGRTLAEQLRQIGARTQRFSYLIHDMSPGAPAPKIAGQFNNWIWQAYSGDPHSNHIHISICDLYYGDPAPVSAAYYDDLSPWGIAGGAPVPVNPTGNMTIAQLVAATLAGKFGNGDARKKALGANYDKVQAIINGQASVPPVPKPKPLPAPKTIAQLATETISGKYGNGDARKRALGGNYNAVMAEVNRRLGAVPSAVNISVLADRTIRGDFGDGDARVRALGANYNAVQAEINRRFGIR